MGLSVIDELLNLDMQLPQSESYGRDGITLSLRTFRITVHGTEMSACKAGCSPMVEPVDITSENEDFTWVKAGYSVWSYPLRLLSPHEEFLVFKHSLASPLRHAHLLIVT